MQQHSSLNTERLSPEAEEALNAEIRRIATACRARDYNEEGIPMYLVLEDVADPERSPQIGSAFHNALLVSAAEMVLAALEFDEVGPKEIATVFEVLASQLSTMNASAAFTLTSEDR